jgi:hypothetical protein
MLKVCCDKCCWTDSDWTPWSCPLQVRYILAATTLEAVDEAVHSLTSLRRLHPSSKPHLLALGIIPILQPHLRCLVACHPLLKQSGSCRRPPLRAPKAVHLPPPAAHLQPQVPA